MGVVQASHGVKDSAVVLVVIIYGVANGAEGDGNLSRFAWELEIVDGFGNTLCSEWAIFMKLNDPTPT